MHAPLSCHGYNSDVHSMGKYSMSAAACVDAK